MIRVSVMLLFGTILLYSCFNANKDAPLEIVASCVENKETFKCICITDSFMFEMAKNREIICATLTNNQYDTVQVHLYKSACSKTYHIRSDHVDYYLLEKDKANLLYSDLIYTPQYDTIVKLKKGEKFSFFIEATCTKKDTIGKVYYFTFLADSIGEKKYPTITYSNF